MQHVTRSDLFDLLGPSIGESLYKHINKRLKTSINKRAVNTNHIIFSSAYRVSSIIKLLEQDIPNRYPTLWRDNKNLIIKKLKSL